MLADLRAGRWYATIVGGPIPIPPMSVQTVLDWIGVEVSCLQWEWPDE